MKVFYEGSDITSRVSVAVCWHDMYAGGKSDELLVKFNDTRRLWDGWAPKSGDKIAIEDAAAKTGEMVVESVKPESSLMVVRALSMPLEAAKVRREKSWEKVKFSQLISEVCNRYGLGFESYGFVDQTYDFVHQKGEPDYQFLARRCAYEGCSLLTYDGKLVVYSGEYMDSQAPAGNLAILPGMDYEFTAEDEKRYGSCQVTDGRYTGNFTYGDGKTCVLNIADRISGQTEADRFAKGLLRLKNKGTRTVRLVTETFLRSYAACSVANIQSTASASWDGPAFVEHMRHDYVRRRSTVWARQCLEGY